MQRTLAAAIAIAALLAPLRAPEIRQHVCIAPSRRALRLPSFEVERIAANVDQAVDRGGAAQYLAARRVHAPAVQMGLRLRVMEPVVARHVHRNRERRGHLDEHRPIRAAVLEQQHGAAAVGAQPIGQHAAGRARADDHVIEFFDLRHAGSILASRTAG